MGQAWGAGEGEGETESREAAGVPAVSEGTIAPSAVVLQRAVSTSMLCSVLWFQFYL